MATAGLFFLACGLVKKLLIADNLAPTVDRLFAAHAELGMASAWTAAVGYSLQLYFDFSGYSDMAVGLALLLGIQFPRNFDSPFRATSIADFWRRWHISLSTFLRDYLFIPLGGSRARPLIVARNLAIVMLLGGLWHGAAWTFVIWGAIHGVLLAGHALLRIRGWTPPWQPVNRALTFVAVVAAFVVFRAPSVGDAADVLGGMLGLNGLGGSSAVRPAGWAVLFIAALGRVRQRGTGHVGDPVPPVPALGLRRGARPRRRRARDRRAESIPLLPILGTLGVRGLVDSSVHRQPRNDRALGVSTPQYDRAALAPRILHLGVGGFHRAHLALYLHELAGDGGDWGIRGLGRLEGDRHMASVLASQDHLYTLIERDSDGSRPQVIGASSTTPSRSEMSRRSHGGSPIRPSPSCR